MSFVFSLEILKLIWERNVEQLRGPILVGKDNNLYRLGDLEKTKEFGGKGKNSTINKELFQIEQLKKQIYDIKKKILS